MAVKNGENVVKCIVRLVSSLCKICDNDVAGHGINLRCSGQVCKCPIWTSPNFKDFAKRRKNSFLPNMMLTLTESLFSVLYVSL